MASRSANIVGNLHGLTIPATGIYAGAEDQDAARNFTGANGIETKMGRRMAIRRHHYNFGAVAPGSIEQANATLRNPRVLSMVGFSQLGGGFPVVTTSDSTGGTTPSNSSNTSVVGGWAGMDRITHGEYDAFWTQCANAVKAIGDPLFVNLWYEPNGRHNCYFPGFQGTMSNTLGSPGSGDLRYRNAWRHVANIFHTIAPNAIMCWALQGPTSFGWYENSYPGDDAVDIIMEDLYRATFRTDLTNPGSHSGGVNHMDYYLFAQGAGIGMTAPISATLGRAFGVVKPFGIAEAGITEGVSYIDTVSAGGNGQSYDKSGSYQSKLLVDLKNFADCIMYIHWNEAGTGNDYVDTSAASTTAYKTFYNDPYCALTYQGGPVSGGNPPIAGSVTISGAAAPTVGTVFTCDPQPATWGGDSPITFSYQWKRDGTGNIGTNSPQYTTVTGDAGHQILCTVTGTNAAGSASDDSPLSATITSSGTASLSTTPTAKTPGFQDSTVSQNNTHAGRTFDGVIVNGVAYIVGSYNQVFDNSGSTPVTHNVNGISAWRTDTWAYIGTWLPNSNNDVNAVWLSADSTKLYCVGSFTNIGGATRTKVAALNVLSGPTDTTPCTAQSIMPNLAFPANAWKIVLDETSSPPRGWVGMAQTGTMVMRIDLNAGAWRISSGFNAPTPAQGGGTAGPTIRAMAFDTASNRLFYGGQNVNPPVTKVNGDSGAAAAFAWAPETSPGAFDIAVDTGSCVYIGGVGQGGDVVVCTDMAGGGPTVTSLGNCNWYYSCDGNLQAMMRGTFNGQQAVYCGHHGDVVATLKNRSYTVANATSHGSFVVTAGPSGGVLLPWNNPPTFTRNNVADGSPLKVFGYMQSAGGDIGAVGDFTTVNTFGSNAFRRFAFFQSVGTGGTVPLNSSVPTVSDTTPSVGDIFDMASHGTWTGSPTSYTYQIIAIDPVGVETTVATNTSFTVTNAYTNQRLVVSVVATNASGNSSAVRSLVTNPIAGGGGVLVAPVITANTEPTNPTTATSNKFDWTNVGAFVSHRYRLTTDGVVGAWNTTTALTATVSTPAGHTYKFEVQASDGVAFSASDQYTWAVTAVTTGPSAPVFLFTPSAAGDQRNVGFVWTHNEGIVGYRWQIRLDTPGSTGTFSNNSVQVADYAPPLSVGSYLFHVRAIDGAGVTGPEATFAFVIDAPGPVAPPLITTSPPGQDTDTEADFTWV